MPEEAIVKKSTGSWYELLTDDGEIIAARVRGRLRLDGMKSTNPVAVGDRVFFEREGEGEPAVILDLMDRRNYIIRKAARHSYQNHIIAANLDQVLIMATLAKPRTSLGFIDRLLLTAEAYEIPATILFNKMDMLNEEGEGEVHRLRNMYESLGYGTLTYSAELNPDIEKLKAVFEGKTTLITGHSGVGKSTLINLLSPQLDLKTSHLSERWNKGRHTTTFAELHIIGPDTYVIDSPGIKEFGLVDVDKEELGHFFPEMTPLLGDCRFSNCLHTHEPGCAIIQAVEEGKIHPERYKSYLSILSGEDVEQ